jgi:2-desacetyl-2-hydroxyethyl bacteriochlorophyllide A dehydrogenase
MKAIVSHGVKDFRLETCPEPVLNDHDVFLAVHFCGVCGTDIHQYHGTWELKTGCTPGHEISGIIEKVGPRVTRFKPGDRVAIDPGTVCWTCDYCREGRTNLCSNRYGIFHYSRGGFSEYTSVPETQVYLLPDGMPLPWGAFLEPASCCVHGIDRAAIKPGQTVAVLGGGAIGLLLMQLALLSGAAKVIVSEPQEDRRQVARSLGATDTVDPIGDDAVSAVQDLAGGKIDVAIESAGLAQTVSQCFDLVKPGGRILLFGVCNPDARVSFHPYQVFRNELTILGTVMSADAFPRTLDLIASEKLRVEPLISHTLPLDRFHEAIELHEQSKGLKILVTPR